MKRPQPIDAPSPFEIDELFFSRTDLRGIIESGNDVFVRVSGHPAENLMGQPHNIIRHPDMPKAVFALLWQTIQTGKPLCAYVKNMAADGRYYWVFAGVFPIKDGYVSIRIKPSTPLFEATKQIYGEALKAEKTQGVEGGTRVLLEGIKKAGFNDYPSFMTAAVGAELRAKEAGILATRGENHSQLDVSQALLDPALFRISETCLRASESYTNIFNSLGGFMALAKDLTTHISSVLKSFKSVHFLVINMSAAAEQSGSSAITMGRVAEGFQEMAVQVQNGVGGFESSLSRLSSAIHAAEFDIGAARLQTEMVTFLILEFLRKPPEVQRDPQKLRELQDNFLCLLGVARTFSDTVKVSVQSLLDVLRGLSREANEMIKLINGLEVIRQRGRIELAFLDGGTTSFNTHIESMQSLIAEGKTSLTASTEISRRFLQGLDQMNRKLDQCLGHFTEANQAVGRLKV